MFFYLHMFSQSSFYADYLPNESYSSLKETGAQSEILKLYALEEKLERRRRSLQGELWVYSTRKFLNLGSRKGLFLGFLQDIFREY